MRLPEFRTRRRGRLDRRGDDRSRLIAIAGVALALLLALLGGASRVTLPVQPIVQAGAIVIAAVALMRPVPAGVAQGMTGLRWALVAFAATMALQLVPLPPALWRALPGHGLEADISDAVGLAATWRPLSIAPDNTLSALLGLVIPAAVLIVFVRTPAALLGRLMWLVAAIGLVELLLGLGQLATGEGALFFYPRTEGTVTGLFHNRNHLAIFLGTLPAVFAYLALSRRDALDRREPLWAGFALAVALAAFGVVLTGSRIGVVVLLATAAGAGLMIWRTTPRVRARVSRPTPRRTRIAVVAGSVIACVGLLGLVLARGDTSLSRIGATDLASEGRVGVLRPLLDLIWRHFPFGAGFGAFDRAFRVIEPENKLRLSYLNHAHNDVIEVLIEGGLASALLLAAVLTLAIRAAITVWRARGAFDSARDLARSGSVVAGGLLLGCVSDYPLRTPMLAGWMTLALCLLLSGAALLRARRDGRAGLDVTGGLG